MSKVTYIHVNQFVIKHNKKHGNKLPAVRVQYGRSGASKYCKEAIIKGPSKLVYSPDKPLSCGAKLWIETEDKVDLVGKVPYSVLRKAMAKAKQTTKSPCVTRRKCRVKVQKAA